MEVKASLDNPLETPRTARIALWGGIAFSVAFTALMWWAGQRLASVPHLPDQGPSWYYWKLATPTFWSHFTAWTFYALHQIAFWSLIFYAQTRVKTYSKGLHPVNLWALGVNVFFILLHFARRTSGTLGWRRMFLFSARRVRSS